MRLVIQRSKNSNVKVNEKIVGSIDKGLVILVSFTHSDNETDIDYMVNKVTNLRIFDDEFGFYDCISLSNASEKSLERVSKITGKLYADTKKGNRPSYVNAMKASDAKSMYELFNQKLRENNIEVQTGIFQAEMDCTIRNDGPVTIIIDSKVR